MIRPKRGYLYLLPKWLILVIWCRNGYFDLFGAETVTMGAETVRSNKSNLTWGSRNGKNDVRPKKKAEMGNNQLNYPFFSLSG